LARRFALDMGISAWDVGFFVLARGSAGHSNNGNGILI